ncbi:MAG: YigZ family protein [Anaerolineaceae bacterium]|nr:YigZ family protein [Anaerolineaceae bacterium]
MSEERLIPAQETEIKIEVLKSRFIATIKPAFSVEEARAFIKEIKHRYPDASHHVPAFLIGFGTSTIAHCSDDGEPSGTAGRPILAVLKASGLGDVVLVVTRYYGGTNLGTGGLVRAYSAAAKEVIENLILAQKVLTTTVSLKLPYHWFEQVNLLIEKHGGKILEREFAADVSLKIQFIDENVPVFDGDLQQLTNGSVNLEIQNQHVEMIVPL